MLIRIVKNFHSDVMIFKGGKFVRERRGRQMGQSNRSLDNRKPQRKKYHQRKDLHTYVHIWNWMQTQNITCLTSKWSRLVLGRSKIRRTTEKQLEHTGEL